jgi:hypothetical protein
MKNSNDTIGNRTCDLPARSAVPQATAPPGAPTVKYLREVVRRYVMNNLGAFCWCNQMVSIFVVCMHVTALFVN